MKISKLTENILMTNRMARNSDKELLILVFNELGADLSEKQKEIFRSFNFESVRRTRQKLQEQGKYVADQKVAKGRALNAMVAQQNMPTTKPQNVDRLTEAVSWLND